MNPILKYPGAKWRIASWITSFFPEHESYLDAYFGSGGVFFSKQPCRIETVNDLDGDIVNFFRVCREQPEELIEALSLTPWAREERDAAYGSIRTVFPTEKAMELEYARRFAVRCWQTFGAFPHKNNGWRHTTAKERNGGPDNPKLWNRLPKCVTDAADRLRSVQIENRPALEVIRRHNGPNVLIYADSPYLKCKRTAAVNAYNHEMSDAEHEELLAALNEHRGMALVSGYDNDLYNDLLTGWHKEKLTTTAECGAIRTESLWINQCAWESSPQLTLELT